MTPRPLLGDLSSHAWRGLPVVTNPELRHERVEWRARTWRERLWSWPWRPWRRLAREVRVEPLAFVVDMPDRGKVVVCHPSIEEALRKIGTGDEG